MPDIELHPLHGGLLRIHRVISRGIDVARERAHAYAKGDLAEASETIGFADYVHALVSVLNAHHSAEEELAFPAFRDRLPDAPWQMLVDEHRAIVPILAELEEDVRLLRKKAVPATWERIAASLDQLADLWRPHFEREEASLTQTVVAEKIPLDEQAVLVTKLAAHSQQHTGPDYLVVPFLLFNLNGDDRRAMGAQFPPVVTEQLVPVVWQDKWLSMRPFLFP